MACTLSLELNLAIFHNKDTLSYSRLPFATIAFRFGKNGGVGITAWQ